MNIIDKIEQIAYEMVDGSWAEEEVAGRFYFEALNEEFVETVGRLRQSTEKGVDVTEDVNRLACEMGLLPQDIAEHIQTGRHLVFPRLMILAPKIGEIQEIKFPIIRTPRLVIEVFSERVAPEDIANIVKTYEGILGPLWFGSTSRKRFKDVRETWRIVRFWAVFCFSRCGKMSQREAIRLWNEMYADRGWAYTMADKGDFSTTNSGESQFSKEKKEYFARLSLTS